jgi:hypothetical protein
MFGTVQDHDVKETFSVASVPTRDRADERKFLQESFVSEFEPPIWHVGLVDVVPRSTGKIPLLAKPVALDLHLKATLDDGIARQLTKRTLWKLEDMRRHAVLLQQRFLQGNCVNISP